MKRYYDKVLRTGDSKGNRIHLKVSANGLGSVRITSNAIEAVKRDRPKFANKDGRLILDVSVKDYPEAIIKLESYLEHLFLKELENEDVHTSIGTGNDSRRNKKQVESSTVGVDEGKGNSSSVYNRPRRRKSTESIGRGDSEDSLDKSSNT